MSAARLRTSTGYCRWSSNGQEKPAIHPFLTADNRQGWPWIPTASTELSLTISPSRSARRLVSGPSERHDFGRLGQRRARQFIGMIGDVLAVIAFDHHHGRVVQRRDD